LKYFSTKGQAEKVDFREATIKGLAPDKGLYFPEAIPQIDSGFFRQIERISNEEISFRVIQPFIGKMIPDEKLFQIVSETISFPTPLVQVSETVSSLELFHGPTLAFKDVGARFMSRCLGFFLKDEQRKVTVLVATSGDTGGAVANGFYKVNGVEVIILYPSGKVSPVQEKQLTTLGENIYALEVDGTFDDCQQMVKQAFTDNELSQKRFLTSANSINVARWLPQQFYYFFAYKQWQDKKRPPVIAVPSGNFGNICAGLLAMQTGLPVKHFIAACNINDVASEYLENNIWKPKTAVATLSNAMDVGDPSNFVRILELFGHRFRDIKNKLTAYTITDDETKTIIKEVYTDSGYLLDPHGAVGYLSLKRYIEKNPGEQGIFIETAHPVKFPEAVEKETGQPIKVPDSLQTLMKKEKQSIRIKPGYDKLKEFLTFMS